MVTATSVGAYHQLKHKETQKQKILEYIAEHGEATIGMIAKALNMEKSTASARVHALKNGETRGGVIVEMPKIEVLYKEKCKVSGVKCEYVGLIEPIQERLFDQ